MRTGTNPLRVARSGLLKWLNKLEGLGPFKSTNQSTQLT